MRSMFSRRGSADGRSARASIAKIAGFIGASLAALAGAWSARAQTAAESYKGQTITIVVGTSAGGGYDAYARLLARHLGRHLPGEPAIVVSNMPGAGSATAGGYVAHVAPKNGTFIAAPNASAPLYRVFQDAGEMPYDPERVRFLGTALSDHYLCIVRSDAPATSFSDMRRVQVIMGGIAANDQTGMMPTVLNNLVGTKFKVVLGYPGFREVMMALEKSEIQGGCGVGWHTVKYQYPALLKSGAIKLVAQENERGHPELEGLGIPLTVDFALGERQRQVLKIIYAQENFARPYFVAAETPPARVALMRRAVMAAWRDPELLADAARINVEIQPRSGEDVEALMKTIYASSPDLFQDVRRAIK